VEDGNWEIGVPTSGPPTNEQGQRAHGGTNAAATVLNGNYAEDTVGRLISPPFVVPSADQLPRLRFWEWWSIGAHDWAQVQIKAGTNDWQALSDPIYYDSSGYWTRAWLDLTSYAGQKVQLGFYLESHSAYDGFGRYISSVGPGWYVDDVLIETGSLPAFNSPESFEHGWGGWRVNYIGGDVTDFGIWQIGPPTSGPGSAHSGANCAATILNGNYPEDRSGRLVSAPFVVPAANQSPRVSFWNWYSIGLHDFCELQIKQAGGDWQTLAHYEGNSTAWSQTNINLSAYATKAVQLGFYFESHSAFDGFGRYISSVGPGWYVDDLFIKTGTISVGALSDKSINEGANLTFPVSVFGTSPGACLSYQLIDPPAGAYIDPTTGVVSWTPEECQGPGIYNLGIYVVDFCNNEANDLGFAKVTVAEVNETPWLQAHTNSVDVLQTNLISLTCWGDPDCPRNPFSFGLLTDAPSGASIDNDGVFRWVPSLAQLRPEPYVMHVRLCDNGTPNFCVTNVLSVTVTTNSLLQVEHLGGDDYRFTLLRGRADRDYELQQSPTLCSCSCQTPWQRAMRVSPTSIPYSFTHRSDHPFMFFRVQEVPRNP
jgi:hypothetical protein